MAETLVRSQLKPAAGVWTTLFAAEGEVVVSTIRCTNVGNGTEKVSVRFAFQGEDIDGKQYICFEKAVPKGEAYSMTEGYTLLTDDLVWVWSEGGETAFSLSGEVKT